MSLRICLISAFSLSISRCSLALVPPATIGVSAPLSARDWSRNDMNSVTARRAGRRARSPAGSAQTGCAACASSRRASHDHAVSDYVEVDDAPADPFRVANGVRGPSRPARRRPVPRRHQNIALVRDVAHRRLVGPRRTPAEGQARLAVVPHGGARDSAARGRGRTPPRTRRTAARSPASRPRTQPLRRTACPPLRQCGDGATSSALHIGDQRTAGRRDELARLSVEHAMTDDPEPLHESNVRTAVDGAFAD